LQDGEHHVKQNKSDSECFLSSKESRFKKKDMKVGKLFGKRKGTSGEVTTGNGVGYD
jgi:hypothetical protein